MMRFLETKIYKQKYLVIHRY